MTLQINGFTLSQSIKRTTKPFISFSQFKNGTTFFNVSLPPTFLNKFSAIWHYLEKLYKFYFFSEFNFDRWFHVKSAKNTKNCTFLSFQGNKRKRKLDFTKCNFFYCFFFLKRKKNNLRIGRFSKKERILLLLLVLRIRNSYIFFR